MAFRKLKKLIQLWRVAQRHETQYVSYSLQMLIFRGREPTVKEIRQLHWRLLLQGGGSALCWGILQSSRIWGCNSAIIHVLMLMQGYISVSATDGHSHRKNHRRSSKRARKHRQQTETQLNFPNQLATRADTNFNVCDMSDKQSHLPEGITDSNGDLVRGTTLACL